MFEQSKAAKRRFYNGNFHNRYFKGVGIDIGGKPDPFSQYVGVFPLIENVKIWDLEDGDAQFMNSCKDESFDFLVSSHCLEHMVDTYEAFSNWIRIVKRGGYLIITIPDEDMYEQGNWPSIYNTDHKWTFTINKVKSWSKKSINILELLNKFNEVIEIEKIEVIKEFYNESVINKDQTLHPNIESCIELIIKKRDENKIIYNKREWFDIQTEQSQDNNLQFAQFYTKMFDEIMKLKKSDKKIVIYGAGSMGKTLKELLKDKTIITVDKMSTNENFKVNGSNIFSPLILKNIDFDLILVSVLGREEEVTKYLVEELLIDKSKLVLFGEND